MTTPLGRRPDTPEPEALMRIDMTPLAVVMLVLVLLLATMLPGRTLGLEANLGPFCENPPSKDPVVHQVSIDFDGTVRWDSQALPDREALDARMDAIGAQPQGDQDEVHIKPSPLADHRVVLGVLVSARQHGITRLGVVSQEPNRL